MLHLKRETEKVWVFTTTYNQGWWLPYFFKHYRFADQIVVYDNGSTDDTKEVCEKFDAEIHDLPSVGFDENVLINCRNSAWKSAKGKADWVIIVYPDELVDNPSGRAATIVAVRVYEMFGFPSSPSPGTPNDWYSKSCVFRPDAITEISFSPGCHVASPSGEIKWDGMPCYHTDPKIKEYIGVDRYIAIYNCDPKYSDLRLLHYRYLHGIDKVIERWTASKIRLQEAGAGGDIAYQYKYDPHVVLRYFEKLATYAKIIA